MTDRMVYFTPPPAEIGPVLHASTQQARFPYNLPHLLGTLIGLWVFQTVLGLLGVWMLGRFEFTLNLDHVYLLRNGLLVLTTVLFYLLSTRSLLFIGRDGLAEYRRDLFGRVKPTGRLLFADAAKVTHLTTNTHHNMHTTTTKQATWVDAQGKTLYVLIWEGGLDAAIQAFLASKEPPAPAPAQPQPELPKQEAGFLNFAKLPEADRPTRAARCGGCGSPLAVGVSACSRCGARA